MVSRGQNFKEFPLNIVGSSSFGVAPKISSEKTYNMYMTDEFMADYGGYQSIENLGTTGRGDYTSNILNGMIVITDNKVNLIYITYNPSLNVYFVSPNLVGNLQTYSGDVTIAENDTGQIAISDNTALYIYDNTATTFVTLSLDFTPGFITFHDSRFLVASVGTNQWRLSEYNTMTRAITFPNDAQHVGQITTKPDQCVAVTRFPSRGNMIFVFGKNVTEPWFDTGGQLFPYQRNSSFNIDYGCVNPSTIAVIDELVVWLAQNEKSGPIIMASDGDMPEKITTDGIDNFMSNLINPADSEAFIYRQNGHIFYHINFYTDNVSLFYDFNAKKFYHACDENMNYFIAKQVAFLNNQYYFVTKNNGKLYAFGTSYETYDGKEIPRIRICRNVRDPSQRYKIINDVGFTIETGVTNYIYQDWGPINLITEDGNLLVTEGNTVFLLTEDGKYLISQDGNNLISQQIDNTDFDYLVSEQDLIVPVTPRVDFSYSINGGQSFGNIISYNLNPIGKGINMLRFWNLGISNDFVAQFRFVGIGRFIATDGLVNLRR